MRLQDPSEFVGIFAVVPVDPRRPYVAHTFVRMGFQFVPPEAALPPGVPRASPEKQEVRCCVVGAVIEKMVLFGTRRACL